MPGTQDSGIPGKLVEGTMKNIEMSLKHFFYYLNQLFISHVWMWFEHE